MLVGWLGDLSPSLSFFYSSNYCVLGQVVRFLCTFFLFFVSSLFCVPLHSSGQQGVGGVPKVVHLGNMS